MQTVKVKQKYNCNFCLYKRREAGKVKEKFDTSWSEKGWKAYIFLGFNEQLSTNNDIFSIYDGSNKISFKIQITYKMSQER